MARSLVLKVLGDLLVVAVVADGNYRDFSDEVGVVAGSVPGQGLDSCVVVWFFVADLVGCSFTFH